GEGSSERGGMGLGGAWLMMTRQPGLAVQRTSATGGPGTNAAAQRPATDAAGMTVVATNGGLGAAGVPAGAAAGAGSNGNGRAAGKGPPDVLGAGAESRRAPPLPAGAPARSAAAPPGGAPHADG